MKLWAWGANSHGQLGLELSEQVETPTEVPLPQFCHTIKQISCGGGHSLLLDDEGNGKHGQLGLGKEILFLDRFQKVQNIDEPFLGKIIQIKLPGGIKIKDITLGSEHTICLAEDNTLWAWGWNEHANTGISMEPVISTPTMIPFDYHPDNIINQIYSGGAHNFIVTKNCKDSNDNQ
ncbi:unnamed protein product, partial [Iphiclides podalirius]